MSTVSLLDKAHIVKVKSCRVKMSLFGTLLSVLLVSCHLRSLAPQLLLFLEDILRMLLLAQMFSTQSSLVHSAKWHSVENYSYCEVNAT